jgi:hypothetical protein
MIAGEMGRHSGWTRWTMTILARDQAKPDAGLAAPGHGWQAGSSTLTVLSVTDSIEPSGLGEHMITLAAAWPAEVRATLVFPTTCAGLHTARRARQAGLATVTLPLAALRHQSAAFGATLALTRPDIVHVHAGARTSWTLMRWWGSRRRRRRTMARYVCGWT